MLLDLLRSPGALTDVVVPEHVGGQVAFHALLREGLLHPIDAPGTGWAPVALRLTAADDATARAAALRHVGARAVVPAGAPLPSGAVVSLQTARWVHVGGALPVTVHVSRATEGRPPLPRPGLTWHELRLQAQDIEVRGGLALTTPVRTAADLALLLPLPVARRQLAGILAHVDPDEVVARLAAQPRSGRAQQLVRSVADAQSWSAGVSCAREPVNR